MSKFFVLNNNIKKDKIIIAGNDYKHIKNVMRMGSGDEIVICDGKGTDHFCVIEEINDSEIICRIEKTAAAYTETHCKITVFQALPKGSKLEGIIQKCVELGAYKIVPVSTKRAIVDVKDLKSRQKKLERYNRIALEACKQCNRGIIPEVEDITDFDAALNKMKESDFCFIPYESEYENEDKITIKEYLTEISPQKMLKGEGASIAFLIGPEGGFDDDEILRAKGKGIKTVTLGPRVLRTETAAPTVISMILYELNEF